MSDLPVEPLFLAEQKNSIIQATIFDDDGDFRSTFAGDVCLCVIARVGLCETGLASPDDVHCKALSMLTSLSEKLSYKIYSLILDEKFPKEILSRFEGAG